MTAISTIAFTAYFASSAPSMAQFKEAQLKLPTLGSFYSAAPKENKALTEFLVAGRFGDTQLGHADEIRAFYESREGVPIWTGDHSGEQKARQFASIIENSWTHGLNPERYNLQQITDRLGDKDESLEAELELFLNDAAIKYTHDMTGNHLGGQVLKGELAPQRTPIAPTEILKLVADNASAQKVFEAMEPRSSTYARLREAYIELTKATPETPPVKVDFGGQIMRPGLRHKNIPNLRARLSAVQQTVDPVLYDDALFAAVTKFQRDAGLKDDGIIGADTITALNRTNTDRIDQLKVNMERLRWMEGQERPGKFIVVNIPAATLWAVDQSGVSFEMQVIVGRPERATPAIATNIEGIRFNPNWTVPPTIKKEDILPKLREDPMYLYEKGIELTYRTENGIETIDPAAVDWEDITPNELHALNMVQMAGAENPLGTVRVLMPNRHSIYLHDTNQKEYFDKYARALSSGCIRMKEPLKVAEFIMNGEKGWDLNKIQSVIAQGKTSDRLITNHIPVYILYYTVWIDDQGRVVFGRDIYGRDKILLATLEKIDGTTTASHNNIMGNADRPKVASLGNPE